MVAKYNSYSICSWCEGVDSIWHLCLLVVVATDDINCLDVLLLDQYTTEWVYVWDVLDAFGVEFGPVLGVGVELVDVVGGVDVLVEAAD